MQMETGCLELSPASSLSPIQPLLQVKLAFTWHARSTDLSPGRQVGKSAPREENLKEVLPPSLPPSFFLLCIPRAFRASLTD